MATHADSPRHVPVNVAGGWKPNQSSESSYAMQAPAGELHDIYDKSREAKFSAKDAGWLKENQGAYLYSRVSVKDQKSLSRERLGKYYHQIHFFPPGSSPRHILSRRINFELARCCQSSVIGRWEVHVHVGLYAAAPHSIGSYL